MNRHPRPRRPSNSLSTAMRRSVHSWTRWRQKRRQLRLQRKQEKLRLLLTPLLLEALTPVAQAMQRLEERQLETRLLLQQQLASPATPQETRELLLEVLSSLQPPAELVISQQLGLPLPPRSYPSSVS